MVGFAGKFVNAVSEVKDVFKTAPKIVGESDQAVKYLAANKPKPTSDLPEEALLEYQAKQDEALDELGYYNLNKAEDPNIPIKGVHDLYEFRETGLRTVDDFGIVGAILTLHVSKVTKVLFTVVLVTLLVILLLGMALRHPVG